MVGAVLAVFGHAATNHRDERLGRCRVADSRGKLEMQAVVPDVPGIRVPLSNAGTGRPACTGAGQAAQEQKSSFVSAKI